MTDRPLLPLSGVRVLDLGRYVAAPLAAQIMGDLGAEVLKIEQPGRGDELRTYGPPFVLREDGTVETGPDHYAVNRNKKSVAISLRSTEGVELIRKLAAKSDVLLQNFRAGVLEEIGLGVEDLKKVNPGLVYCAISGFGSDGPYRERPGLDSIFQAASGLMSLTGEADGPPMKAGATISDVFCALYSTIGILAGLRHREVQGGPGQALDMAVLETSIASLLGRAQRYLACGVVNTRFGNKVPGNEPGGVYACSDGSFILSAGTDAQFRTLMDLLGYPEMADDPLYRTRHLRGTNQVALTEWLEAVFRQQTRDHWIRLLSASGLMCGPVNGVDDALEDRHVQARGMVGRIDQPDVGEVRIVSSPLKFSETPIENYAPVRRVGQDTAEVLERLVGLSRAEIAALQARGAIGVVEG